MSATPTYEFSDEFVSKIAALTMRDPLFNQRVEGLIEPSYFSDAAEASLVKLSIDYFKTYKRVPADKATWLHLMREGFRTKVLRDDLKAEIVDAYKRLGKVDISDRDLVVDTVAEFAKHQALWNALEKAAGLLEKRKFEEMDDTLRRAFEVGQHQVSAGYDYYARIEERTQERRDIAAGKIKPTGITTGHPELDACLFHNGWGRKELSLLLGAAKAGKSMGLVDFAKGASLAGFSVLYLTLEVSTDITSKRLDACHTEVAMRKLTEVPNDVETKIKALKGKVGPIQIEEFPTGTLKPSEIRRLLRKYEAQGTKFDLIIVDYADIMAPERWTPDPIENSRTIFVDLRAIAQEENAAVLSATQANREGAKAAVVKATNVAEDFNRIRIADVVISINATDEEKGLGEARLFFAASRNTADGFTIRIQQDRESSRFIKKVLGKVS